MILHHTPFEDEEPRKIQDGEYLWDGNKIQVDSDGKVIMINGEIADVQLKKKKMENSKRKEILARFTKWMEDKGLKAKVVDTDDDEAKKAEEKKVTIAKLKAFAKEKFGEERAEKFIDVTLADGTIAVIEPDVEAGAAMVINDSEGTPVPAPIGEYELEDGRVIVVEEAGVIASVTDAPDEEEEEEDLNKDKKPAEKKDAPTVKRIIDSITQEKVFATQANLEKLVGHFNTLKESNEALIKENEELKENIVEFQKMTKEVFDELLAEPSKKPVVKSKHPFEKEGRKTNIFEKPFKL